MEVFLEEAPAWGRESLVKTIAIVTRVRKRVAVVTAGEPPSGGVFKRLLTKPVQQRWGDSNRRPVHQRCSGFWAARKRLKLRFDCFDQLGVAGFGSRCEAVDQVAFAVDQELLEIPADTSLTGWLDVLAGQVLVQWRGVVTVDFDLAEHWERDVVAGAAELLDFGLGARFLAAKLIAGESEHDESFAFVFLVQLFETGILGSQSALAGGVDDQDHLAFVAFQINFFAVDVGHFEIKGALVIVLVITFFFICGRHRGQGSKAKYGGKD